VGAFHLLDLEDPQDVHRELERGQLQGMCKAEVMRLPLKERMAIMHTCNDQSMASMGSAVGLSRERIRQLRNRAIGKVRAAMGVHE
jgi:DNA-directed RNA polymerase sigma subunit (sigma70/sigma32)